MEPLFTNKCIYTKKAYLEGLFGFLRKRRIIMSVFFIVLIVALSFQIIEGYSIDTYEVILAISCTLLILYSHVLQPIIHANYSNKRNIELFKQAPVLSYDFFDAHFVSYANPSNSTLTFQYNQIRRIISTKQYYLLIIRYNLYNIVDKNGFDKINMVEFERFIKEKAVKAKVML